MQMDVETKAIEVYHILGKNFLASKFNIDLTVVVTRVDVEQCLLIIQTSSD